MISVTRDTFRLAEVFTIARGSRTEAQVLTVRAFQDGVMGWAECVPYARYGETLDSVTAQIEGLAQGIHRQDLQDALPAGAARSGATSRTPSRSKNARATLDARATAASSFVSSLRTRRRRFASSATLTSAMKARQASRGTPDSKTRTPSSRPPCASTQKSALRPARRRRSTRCTTLRWQRPTLLQKKSARLPWRMERKPFCSRYACASR